MFLREAVAVELGGDVEVVHAGPDACVDERLGGALERAGAVQEDGGALEGGVDEGRVVDGEDAEGDLEGRGELLQFGFASSREDDFESEAFCIVADKSPGVA